MRRAGGAPARTATDELRLIAEELEAGRERHPGPAPRADVRLRASGDRRRDPRAADPADRAGLRCRDHRVGLPGRARHDGPALSRAKNKIRQAGVPFRVPERADLRERLDAVLAAIYAAFAEGWSDPDGTEARRRNLAEEGDLARPPRGLAAAGRARGARPARPDAARRGAPRRAARRRWRLRAARRAGHRRVGCASDR